MIIYPPFTFKLKIGRNTPTCNFAVIEYHAIGQRKIRKSSKNGNKVI